MPRHGAWTRLQDHFHQHPAGRLHEILFWVGLGLVTGALTLWTWMTDRLSTPFALMLGFVALLFIGWAMLPQQPRIVAPPAKGGRRSRR